MIYVLCLLIGVIAGLGTQLTPLRDVVLRLDRKRDQS